MAGMESTEAADLESGYSDTPTTTPAVKEPVEQANNEAEVQTEPTATPAPTPAPFDAQAEFRKLQDTMNGRVGDLTFKLQQALKAKEEAETPVPTPTPAPTRIKRTTDNYPELAEQLGPDIDELVSELAGKAADPKHFQEMMDKRHQTWEAAQAKQRVDEVSEIHPGWIDHLWAKDAEGKSTRTPDYEAWAKTLTPEEVSKFEGSNSVLYVDRKLDQFYAWKKAQAAQAQPVKPVVSTRQKRLEAAVTPRGTGGHAQGGSTEIDEMEAGYSG